MKMRAAAVHRARISLSPGSRFQVVTAAEEATFVSGWRVVFTAETEN